MHGRTVTVIAAAILSGVATTACARPVAGQGVTGVVRDSATSRPLPGVLVSVFDAVGERTRATLTDDAGGYAVEVPLGRYQLRAERIGLRPTDTEPFDVRTFDVVRRDVLMTDRAVEIAGLTVDARVQSCRLDPEGALRIQRWWGEVRTALRVSSVLQGQRFAEFEVESFEREWDEDVRRLLDRRSRVEVSTSSRPFVSADASYLSEGGFVQGEPSGVRQYYAPDADVLLSNVFLSDHCFTAVEDDDFEDQLGLRFEPVGDRDVAEIEGTLWVDTTTAELRTLDFSYIGAGLGRDSEAGGRVDFRYLDSGAWIVSDWYIRMPKLGVRRERVGDVVAVVGWVDVGGVVTPVDRAEPSAGDGPMGAIRGVVYDSIRQAPLPDATVALLGTGRTTTTDAAGEFILTNVPVGDHRLTFRHEELAIWGLGASAVEVQVRERRTAEAFLGVPGFRQAALVLCRGGGFDARTVVLGHVLDRDRRPLGNVPLELSWRFVDDDEARVLPARTGSDGRFVVCSLPPEVEVAVRAELDGLWTDLFVVASPEREVTYREVWLAGR